MVEVASCFFVLKCVAFGSCQWGTYSGGMIELVEQKKSEVAALCRKYQVERLDLFGSAATGTFDPAFSDLDFIVAFENHSAPGLLDRYLDLAEALERLFNRHVDLITQRSVRNPYFRQTIEMTRLPLYRIIHGYDTVDDELVWDAVQHHIPALLSALRRMF